MPRSPEGVTFHKGRFVAQLSLGKDPATGKRRRRQFTADPCAAHREEGTVETCRGCQQVARELRAEKLTELAGNTYVEPSDMTLGQWLDSFLEAHRARIRKTTWRGYKTKVRGAIKPRIGHVPLQQVDATLLEGFYSRLLEGDELKPEGYARASVQQVHAILRRALKDAVRPRGQYLLYNPASEATVPADNDSAEDVAEILHTWTAPQLRTFLAETRDHPDFAFFWLAAVTGMRRSELCGLKWDMVDLERGAVHVQRGRHDVNGEEVWAPPKSKRSRRWISLSEQQCAFLREHRKRQMEQRLKAGPAWADNDLVFCNEAGGGLKPDSYSQAFDRAVARVKVPRIRLHDLRHTHATLLLEAGRPVKEVSARLGHSTTAFTMDKYAHVTDNMRDATADVVDDLLGEG